MIFIGGPFNAFPPLFLPFITVCFFFCFLGNGCQPCVCNMIYAIDMNCMDSGQCNCQPGVGGIQCDRCAPGYCIVYCLVIASFHFVSHGPLQISLQSLLGHPWLICVKLC